MKTVIEALYKFIAQKPGLEFGNYGDWKSYRAEVRSIGKDLSHARTLLRACELAGLTDQQMIDAARGAYSGRLTLAQDDHGGWRVYYCTGQYWPTEYRRAVAAVAAAALWAHWRDDSMPESCGKLTRNPGQPHEYHLSLYRLPGSTKTGTAGDYLRTLAQRNFGRGIAQRWFA